MLPEDTFEKETVVSRTGYFGFTEGPFDYCSNTRFFYPAPSRLNILTKILDQYEKKLIRMMIVGKCGSGKTSMAQKLTAFLAEAEKVEIMHYFPLIIPHQELTLLLFLEALQLDWQVNYERSLQYLKDYLIQRAAIQNPIFIIVEDNIPHKPIFADSILYELLQLRYETEPVFHIVWFAAEKPLKIKYVLPDDMDEYVNLSDMTYREMAGMIKYRCQLAGRKKPLFTKEALKQIYHLTNGQPGLTIRLCDFAIDEAVSERKHMCGIEEVQTAWDKWVFPSKFNIQE